MVVVIVISADSIKLLVVIRQHSITDSIQNVVANQVLFISCIDRRLTLDRIGTTSVFLSIEVLQPVYELNLTSGSIGTSVGINLLLIVDLSNRSVLILSCIVSSADSVEDSVIEYTSVTEDVALLINFILIDDSALSESLLQSSLIPNMRIISVTQCCRIW